MLVTPQCISLRPSVTPPIRTNPSSVSYYFEVGMFDYYRKVSVDYWNNRLFYWNAVADFVQ